MTGEEVSIILDVLLLVICSVNIIIQVFGCHILISIYKNGQDKVGDLYIISLSLAELICSSFVCVEKIFYFTDMTSVYTYLTAFHFTSAALVYYLSMFYITTDKLLEVLLNIRLPVYWNIEKAKVLLVVTWIAGGLFGFSVVLAFKFAAFNFGRVLLFYLFPTLDVAFLVLAVPTYLFLFHMFKTARTQRPSMSKPMERDVNKSLMSWWKAFRESTFYTAVLMISAFIGLVIIPDLVILIGDIKLSPHLRLVCALLCREFSFVVDAFIYVLTIKKVNHRMKRIFCRPKWCCSNQDEPLMSLRSKASEKSQSEC